MKSKELNSNLSLKITTLRIKEYLEKLTRVYVFIPESIKTEWITPTNVTLQYILKRREEVDHIKISVLRKKKGTLVIIQGEKIFPLEYFLIEIQKIL